MFENLYNNLLKELPVKEIADDVVTNVNKGIQIVSSPTGSGKTLTIPAKWADRIPENERVVVLVPRRFLAINAAETIAELSHTTLGEEVGYAVGTQGGEEPLYKKDSKIVFMTYGYAISSNAISYEKNIVLDEVHEASIDISIVKAILQNRKKEDDNLNIIEMSATIDLNKQLDYWKDFNPTANQCDGKTFGCEIIEEDEKSEAEEAITLLNDHGRKGIAVFQPGRREIEEVKAELKELLIKEKIDDVEVAAIYGEMDGQERRKALKAPEKGKRKVIIGTNVIESGMNIPWLDAGISSGTGKGLYATSSGAVVLKQDDLPQWRLQQQKGRVCRFTDGIFVLASDRKWAERPVQTVAEISRLPLTELVMTCYNAGLQIEDLKFDAVIDQSQLRLAKQKLLRLKLINENNKITPLGRFANQLPVNVETALMLKYAQSREYCLPQAVMLAGIMEQGSMRQNFKEGHHQNSASDDFDALLAFANVERELNELRARNRFKKQISRPKTFAQKLKEKEKSQSELEDEALSYPQREEIFKKYNVSKKRFYDARETMKDISRRFKIKVDFTDTNFDFDKLKQCMLAGSISKLYIKGTNIFDSDESNISNSSNAYRSSPSHYIATPKVISPKNGGRQFTICEGVTAVSDNDITKFISKNMDLISKVDSDGDFHIMDSHYIRHNAASETIKDFYNEKINRGMTILENKGIEQFKEYAAENKIPETFWRGKIGDSETSNEDAIRQVLGLPEVKKPYNLHEILGIPDQGFDSTVVINKEQLTKLGILNNNHADIKISPLHPVKFDIKNPEVNLDVTIVGEKSNSVSFQECELQKLDITSENPNYSSAIDIRSIKIDEISIHDINLGKLEATRLNANSLEINNAQSSYMEFDNSAIDSMSIKGGIIGKIDIYYMNFSQMPDFKEAAIGDIQTGTSTTYNNEPLYYHKVEEGFVASNISREQKEQQLREAQYERERQAEQQRREQEDAARLRTEQISQVSQSLQDSMTDTIINMDEAQIIRSMGEFLNKNQETLPVLPNEAELLQLKENLFEEKRQKIAQKEAELQQKENEINNSIADYQYDYENATGLIVSAAELGQFIDKTYKEDTLAQQLVGSLKRAALYNIEERVKERKQDIEVLQEIFYDAIAKEITDVNGEVIRSAGDSKGSRSRIYSHIYDDAGEHDINNWYNINITGEKPQDGTDIYDHNIRFIEEKYVLPDIKNNYGYYDSEICSFNMDRTPKPVMSEADEKKRLKEAKKAAKNSEAETVINLAALSTMFTVKTSVKRK